MYPEAEKIMLVMDNLNTHKHSGVMIGGDKTGGPE